MDEIEFYETFRVSYREDEFGRAFGRVFSFEIRNEDGTFSTAILTEARAEGLIDFLRNQLDSNPNKRKRIRP